MPQIDRRTKLTANEPGRVLERIHRLPRDVPIADDSYEHFRVVHILRDLNARHSRKTKPHIAHILRDNLGERTLQCAVDPALPFPFHEFRPIRINRAKIGFIGFTIAGKEKAITADKRPIPDCIASVPSTGKLGWK